MAYEPQSRLDDRTLANSRAIDASRRAASDQRQRMGVERSMQRQFRRAVRHGDIQAISALGNQMDSMGLSRIGKGGIASAEENDAEAFRRAETQRQAGAQVGREIDAMTGRGGVSPVGMGARPDQGAEGPVMPSAGQQIEAATRTLNPRASAGAGYGRSIDPKHNLDSEADRAVRSREQLGVSDGPVNGPAQPGWMAGMADNRQKFIYDLNRSDLFKSGDADALERAATRGAKFGISKDQLIAHSQGKEATPEAMARDKAEQAELDKVAEAFGSSGTDEPSDLMKMAMGIKSKAEDLGQQISSGMASVDKSRSEIASLLADNEKNQIPFEATPEESARLGRLVESRRFIRNEIEKQRQADEKEYGDKVSVGIRDSAAKQAAREFGNPYSLKSPEQKQRERQIIINEAIKGRVDITSLTKNDPALAAAYDQELALRKDAKSRFAAADNLEKQAANLLAR
jgi:hypothetical protein